MTINPNAPWYVQRAERETELRLQFDNNQPFGRKYKDLRTTEEKSLYHRAAEEYVQREMNKSPRDQPNKKPGIVKRTIQKIIK